jgi:hypothetical protein
MALDLSHIPEIEKRWRVGSAAKRLTALTNLVKYHNSRPADGSTKAIFVLKGRPP